MPGVRNRGPISASEGIKRGAKFATPRCLCSARYSPTFEINPKILNTPAQQTDRTAKNTSGSFVSESQGWAENFSDSELTKVLIL